MTEKINYSDENKIRLNRLKTIKKNGINPYPKEVKRTHQIGQVLADFKKLKKFTIVGRLRSIRLHGGSCFVNLEDESGKIQAYFKKDEVGDKDYRFFKNSFDVGDFIEITGSPFTTKRGEKSVLVKNFKMLTKSILPLPEKWHGLSDVETRFRKRYLDLISNPEVKNIFSVRSKLIQFIRDYFIKEGFIEVDTPILQQVASGAIAKPFKTHHNALDTDMYLRIAPELYLKELIVGGYEKVFEIARCFRNEGVDYAHNPEFSQIEFYWAYQDYEGLMKFMEKFMPALVKNVVGKTKVEYDGHKIDFKGPYPRLDFREALLKEAKIDLDKHDAKSLTKEAKKKGLRVEEFWGKGKIADELFKKFVRTNMINPTYIINHPIELSPLAKKIVGRENYVERFQLIVGGKIELMNAFSELNDPIDQEERFKFQQSLTAKGDEEAMGKDDEFIEALKYGMPPTAGLGMGIDRLVNILTNTHNIKEVILFPTLKPEGQKVSKAGKSKETMMAVILVNKELDLEDWEEMNTVAHLTAAFGAREGKDLLQQDSIFTKDNDEIKLNIQHAIMIKEAKSNKDILKLINKAKEKELEIAEFTREMLETTDDKKIAKITSQKKHEEVEYLGALVYGKIDSVKKLTKDFKLFN